MNESKLNVKTPLSISAIALGVVYFFLIVLSLISIAQILFFLTSILLFLLMSLVEFPDFRAPSTEIVIAVLALILISVFIFVNLLTGYLTADTVKYRVKTHCFWVGFCLVIMPQILFSLGTHTIDESFEGEAYYVAAIFFGVSALMIPLIMWGGYIYERRNSRMDGVAKSVVSYIEREKDLEIE